MEENLIKISELIPTTELKSADIIPISQDGETRSIKGAVLEQKLLDKTDARYIENAQKGAPNGIAPLDLNSKVPNENLNFGTVSEGDSNVVSGGEVFDFTYKDIDSNGVNKIIGYNGYVGSEFNNTYLNSFTEDIVTIIINEKISDYSVLDIEIFAVTEGNINLNSYTIENNIAVRKDFKIISLKKGINVFKDFIFLGDYIGFNFNNTNALGRIGISEKVSRYTFYKENINISSGTVLKKEINSNEIGIKINVVRKDSLVNKVKDTLSFSDLTIESNNLIDISRDVVKNTLINSQSQIQKLNGWDCIKFDISSVDDKFTLSNITSERNLMSGLFMNNDIVIGQKVDFNPRLEKNTFTKVENATHFIFTSKTPNESDSVYINAMANKGIDKEEFEPYKPLITKIKGIDLKGGGVDINGVVNNLEVKNLTLNAVDFQNVPIWDEQGTPPINIGYEYLFKIGNNAQRRVRMV